MFKIRLCLWTKDCVLLSEKIIHGDVFGVNVGDWYEFTLKNGDKMKGLFDSINITHNFMIVDYITR